jgi:hypothetical protein
MVTKTSGCYYGAHFGCLNVARDPNCDRCAERLTNAVNYRAASRCEQRARAAYTCIA